MGVVSGGPTVRVNRSTGGGESIGVGGTGGKPVKDSLGNSSAVGGREFILSPVVATLGVMGGFVSSPVGGRIDSGVDVVHDSVGVSICNFVTSIQKSRSNTKVLN